MEKLWTPTDQLKKRVMYSLVGGELFILLLFSINVFGSYSLPTSLILLLFVIIFCIVADIYLWKKLSLEYLLLDENGIEWAGNRCEWEFVEEVRIKREKEKPMFLVIREGTYYHKIPLRLYGGQTDAIFEKVQQLGFEITG